MTVTHPIPIYTLYGETDQFPDVVHCESFSARAPEHNWQISPHRHSSMAQLFVFFDGRADASVDDMNLTLKSMEYLFIPARCVHGFQIDPGIDGLIVSVPNTIVESIRPATEDLRRVLSSPIRGRINMELKTLVEALRTISRSSGIFRVQRSIGLAHSVLAHIAESRMLEADLEQHLPQVRLHRLDSLITENMSKGWTATDYAQALAITTGHLSRLSRAACGLGATAYIEQHMMVEASRLLAFTQLSVSEIGYRLGYSDPSYFSKRFKKAMTITPTAYRAQFIN